MASFSHDYAHLRRFISESVDASFLARHGAHGVGIGPRNTANRTVRSGLCLRIYVERKQWSPQLVSRMRPMITVTDSAGDSRTFPTDVIQSARSVPQSRHGGDRRLPPPAPAGGSCSLSRHESLRWSSGTLGGCAWDSQGSRIVALSNYHVLGGTRGRTVHSPAKSVPGAPDDWPHIGTVELGCPAVAADATTVDCAVATLIGDEMVDLELPHIGYAVFDCVDATELSSETVSVMKYSSDVHRIGQIVDFSYYEQAVEALDADLGLQAKDCLRIEPHEPGGEWSQGGDSGAVVFLSDALADGSGIRSAVGLHFRGGGDPATKNNYGIACKLPEVFRRLGLAPLGGGAFEWFFAEIISRGPTSAQSHFSFTGASRDPLPAAATHAGTERFNRLISAAAGGSIGRAVSAIRGPLLALIVRDAAVRTATIEALVPFLLAGSGDAILDRPVDAEDDRRIGALLGQLTRFRALQPTVQRIEAVLAIPHRSLRQILAVTRVTPSQGHPDSTVRSK